MASSSDAWMREYNDALKLSEDINGMMSERNSSALTGPDAQRRASAIRRKITILGTRLDSLQSFLVKVPGKQHVYVILNIVACLQATTVKAPNLNPLSVMLVLVCDSSVWIFVLSEN